MFKENYSFFHSHYFQMHSNQSKNVSECLLELIRALNSNQTSNEYALIKNNSPLINNLLIDFKIDEFFRTSFDQIQISTSFKSFLNDCLAFNLNLKSKAFIYENLLDSFILLKQKLNYISKIDSNYAICNSSENLTSEFKSLLNQCINNDRNNVEKYLSEILKRISILNEKYNLNFINEVNIIFFYRFYIYF
jgi:hypothetical protein